MHDRASIGQALRCVKLSAGRLRTERLSALVSNRYCLYGVRRACHQADQPRRGGRVVECTALEMRHGCKPIGGSNPPLSANQLVKSLFLHGFT